MVHNVERATVVSRVSGLMHDEIRETQARLFSLDRGGGAWDGATIVDADPAELLRLAHTISANRFLSEDPFKYLGERMG